MCAFLFFSPKDSAYQVFSIIKACGNVRKAKTLEQFLASFLCDITKTPVDSYSQMWCRSKALHQRGLHLRGSLLPISDRGPCRLCTGGSQHLPSVPCERAALQCLLLPSDGVTAVAWEPRGEAAPLCPPRSRGAGGAVPGLVEGAGEAQPGSGEAQGKPHWVVFFECVWDSCARLVL